MFDSRIRLEFTQWDIYKGQQIQELMGTRSAILSFISFILYGPVP